MEDGKGLGGILSVSAIGSVGLAGSEGVFDLGGVAAEEGVDGGWGNGLLQKSVTETYAGESGLVAVDANGLGDGLVLLGGVVDKGGLHHGVELDVGGLVDAAVEALGGRGVRGLSVGLAEHVFALDAGDVASVA